MKILITNSTLALRAGTELYARDLAIALKNKGHEVAAYSNVLGEVGMEIREAGIEVCDNLDDAPWEPDIIHGHHHLECMTALIRFPKTPVLFVSHGWIPWEEIPPRHPRILKYVAVDKPTRDAAVFKHGIDPDRIRVIPNFVDMKRFERRAPLPDTPQRALLLSNSMTEEAHLPYVRSACEKKGIPLSIVGWAAGRAEKAPEQVLKEYDIVFAKGRAALEALAVGTAVVICDTFGIGPMITTQDMKRIRTLDCDYEKMYFPLHTDTIVRQIERYDPSDATAVSDWVRDTAGIEHIINELTSLYDEVLEEYRQNPTMEEEEDAATSAYLRWLSNFAKRAYAKEKHHKLTKDQLAASRAEKDDLRAEKDQMQIARDRALAELRVVNESLAVRLRESVLRVPVLGRKLHKLSGRIKSRRQSRD